MGSNDNSSQRGNAILVFVAMAMGVLIGLMFSQSSHRKASRGDLQGRMSEVLSLVENEYVDEIETDSLSERLIAAMLAELDPHSTFLSAKESERSNEMMRGSFEGVGLVIHREGDTSFVGQVMSDGPSAGTGLMPGDMIETVDGVLVSGCGMPADSVVARLRGRRGTPVTIGIIRPSLNGTAHTKLNIKVRRGVVPHHSLLHSTMLDDTTGYILLGSFAATSHDEFHDALAYLIDRGMRHLIFDLRGNGGGSLNSAIGICDELLPRGSLIVYTSGAHSRRRDVRAHGSGLFTDGRITVLVDENSASASEVVSGALQDNDRATIVGRRTFGKGLVQTDFSLKDGSSLMLTTARYYTPSGRCIQRSYNGGTNEYYRDYLNQLIEETYADSITMHVNDTTPYYTVGGRTVYGGGGIMPDHVLPLRKDSSFIYYNQLSGRGLINSVAFLEVRRHAADLLKRYPTARDFGHNYHVSSNIVEELVRAGEKAGIPRNPSSLKAQRKLVETMIKAYIGQALYGDEAFYDAYIPQDDDLQRARNINKTFRNR